VIVQFLATEAFTLKFAVLGLDALAANEELAVMPNSAAVTTASKRDFFISMPPLKNLMKLPISSRCAMTKLPANWLESI